jgi:hypothetical protein
MKTLDLNAYGVEEMRVEDTVTTEGGILSLLISAVGVYVALALTAQNAY